jgi:hypothetical protein
MRHLDLHQTTKLSLLEMIARAKLPSSAISAPDQLPILAKDAEVCRLITYKAFSLILMDRAGRVRPKCASVNILCK